MRANHDLVEKQYNWATYDASGSSPSDRAVVRLGSLTVVPQGRWGIIRHERTPLGPLLRKPV
jgi:hypothetical protein